MEEVLIGVWESGKPRPAETLGPIERDRTTLPLSAIDVNRQPMKGDNRRCLLVEPRDTMAHSLQTLMVQCLTDVAGRQNDEKSIPLFRVYGSIEPGSVVLVSVIHKGGFMVDGRTIKLS